jgi:PTH1 family peptidyl-tRNA hydrolase
MKGLFKFFGGKKSLRNTYLIVGLGNRGAEYDNTRHNVGFDTINFLARYLEINVTKLKFKAYIGEGKIGDQKIVLIKPQTYMNLSGESVREAIKWYKVDPSNLIVIYDDIDIDVGKLRIRPKGSSGTHNGMKSIIHQIKSDEFPRIRIGVGRPPKGFPLANFVLSKFSPDEKKLIEDIVEKAGKAVEGIIESGLDVAMNKFNVR